MHAHEIHVYKTHAREAHTYETRPPTRHTPMTNKFDNEKAFEIADSLASRQDAPSMFKSVH
jgi:hypothetical protein